LPSAAAGVACAFIMPRGVRNPLPDLSDVDPIELQLALLAVLEERLGPQTRNLMRKMQFGDLLTYAGGARVVLAQALARLRKRQFDR
jgi:hypothetical protein